MAERRRSSVPQTIGGVLVGFDEQVWNRRPPAQERAEQVDRLGTVVGSGTLTIVLPEPPDGSGRASTAGSEEDRRSPADPGPTGVIPEGAGR